MFLIYFFLFINIFLSSNLIQAESKFTYRQELKSFKESPKYQTIFDEDANPDLKDIQRDIENFNKSTLVEQIFPVFSNLEAIIVTPETMPSLYQYIKEICIEQEIVMPRVFLSDAKGFYNAAALKMLMLTGSIVIGAKLINEISDEALEAVIAHELGHIKYNHSNKILALNIATYLGIKTVTNKFFANKKSPLIDNFTLNIILARTCANLIIGKNFERQADEFAYRKVGKGYGLIEFFEELKTKEAKAEALYTETEQLINENKTKLGWYGYSTLSNRYMIVKCCHLFSKAARYIYHNTPFGRHPSHKDRIRTIKRHLNIDLQ